jgi:hypothetical protein
VAGHVSDGLDAGKDANEGQSVFSTKDSLSHKKGRIALPVVMHAQIKI